MSGNTRGIHGLTCNVSSSNPAILLDGTNNSLEDVSITYVQGNQQGSAPDGILVGSQRAAQNNILVNITGANLSNIVHISGNSNAKQGNCPVNACDVTVLGITNSLSTSTIQDDVTSTTLTDATLGMYVLSIECPRACAQRT